MRFEFATATRVIFGPGTVQQVGAAAADMGRRAFLVTGRDSARAAAALETLSARGVESSTFSVAGEPTTEIVRRGVRRAREAGCDMVVGFGGGSALDAAKTIAVLLTNGGEVEDYLEVVGRGAALTRPSMPCIAIPTTAGTGTEVTRNAVLGVPEARVKASLRSPHMLPRLSVVDPQLTYSLPPAVTAGTGMDALTQLIEPFVSVRANPLSDALAREGMRRAARSLRRAYENGEDVTAREDMALASLLGGLALANAGLGAVHGFANPIGGMFPAPHGAICARLLPATMEINLRALREREPQSSTRRRYDEIAQLLTGSDQATAIDGVAWVHDLCEALHIPRLAAYGVTVADLPALVDRAAVASSMQANPIRLTRDELHEIVAQAL